MATSNSQSQTQDWQCNKSLVQCLDHLLTSGIASDVTFMVGDQKRRQLSAHKIILISRSPVFYAMLEGPLAEKGEIIVTDISAETFSMFLRYLYTDEIQLTVQTVTPVLSAARKYFVDKLVKKCDAYIRANLKVENACLLLEQAHVFTEESLREECLDLITRVPEDVLYSNSFEKLCPDCLRVITSCDNLPIEENRLFEGVMRWASAECGRQKLALTDSNKRQVLGDILYTIRFPVMEKTYLTLSVSYHDVLTAEEYRSILRCHQDTRRYPCNLFSMKRRILPTPIKGRFDTIHRFHKDHLQPWDSRKTNDDEAIMIKSSHDFSLHGLRLYGTSGENKKVTIGVYNKTGRTLYKGEHEITDQVICNVQLLNMVRLKREVYTTVVLHGGVETVSTGRTGYGNMTYKHAKITFKKSTLYPSKYTDVEHGQIPGFLVSL